MTIATHLRLMITRFYHPVINIYYYYGIFIGSNIAGYISVTNVNPFNWRVTQFIDRGKYWRIGFIQIFNEENIDRWHLDSLCQLWSLKILKRKI